MKRRSFVTVTGTLALGSASLVNRPSLAIQIDTPATVQTEISEAETIIIGFENIHITPNNLDDSENLIMKINSVIDGTDVGTILQKEIEFAEGEKIKLPGLYVDILDNPNVDSSMLKPDNMYTVTVDLQFLFEHPQVKESQNESFTLSFTSGELDSTSGFSVVEEADTRTISLDSVKGTGGLEMAVWDNSRYDQNKKTSATPKFDNYASGDKGLGVFDLEGRKFGTNASQNDGESSLVKPSTDVTTGTGDPPMALWDASRKNQMKRQGDSPSFDNYASGDKGRAIMHVEGRQFSVSPSVEDGEIRDLSEPSDSVIN